jgi:hypothetical protein
VPIQELLAQTPKLAQRQSVDRFSPRLSTLLARESHRLTMTRRGGLLDRLSELPLPALLAVGDQLVVAGQFQPDAGAVGRHLGAALLTADGDGLDHGQDSDPPSAVCASALFGRFHWNPRRVILGECGLSSSAWWP